VATFALIHGSWHGGWCWEAVASRLHAAGHRAVAPDLPCDVVAAGAADYSTVVVDAIGGEKDVVVVAHSSGGLIAPIVAGRAGARSIVLVAALLPDPGRTFVEQNRQEHILLAGYQPGVEADEQGRRTWRDPAIARSEMYNGCDAQSAAWAYERLRPQAPTLYAEVTPLDTWPDIAVVDVRGGEDRIVSPDWARRAVPDRLGIASVVLDGVGHSVMLSHPDRLTEILAAA
jgi:pimeloyl-ACP methyl ester carboxylesterase